MTVKEVFGVMIAYMLGMFSGAAIDCFFKLPGPMFIWVLGFGIVNSLVGFYII